MTLDEWVDLHRGDLVPEAADTRVVRELRGVVDREIQDAEVVVSPEGKLMHAHSACLAIASATLAISGYRVRRGSPNHHWRLIESLEFTLGLAPRRVKELQEYRKKRSLAVYERAGIVTGTEADAALAAARCLRDQFLTWLAKEHPDLLR